MGKPVLFTAEEAAEYLRVSVDTVRRYVRERRFPAAKVGRGYLIREEDLEAYLGSLVSPVAHEPSAAEAAQAEAAWRDYLAGRDPGKPLKRVWREQIEERRD